MFTSLSTSTRPRIVFFLPAGQRELIALSRLDRPPAASRPSGAAHTNHLVDGSSPVARTSPLEGGNRRRRAVAGGVHIGGRGCSRSGRRAARARPRSDLRTRAASGGVRRLRRSASGRSSGGCRRGASRLPRRASARQRSASHCPARGGAGARPGPPRSRRRRPHVYDGSRGPRTAAAPCAGATGGGAGRWKLVKPPGVGSALRLARRRRARGGGVGGGGATGAACRRARGGAAAAALGDREAGGDAGARLNRVS